MLRYLREQDCQYLPNLGYENIHTLTISMTMSAGFWLDSSSFHKKHNHGYAYVMGFMMCDHKLDLQWAT